MVVRAHWAGINERAKVLVFYLDEGELVYIGNMFRPIDTIQYWWPGHAEVYTSLWYEVSLRCRLDLIILDRNFYPADELVEQQVFEF